MYINIKLVFIWESLDLNILVDLSVMMTYPFRQSATRHTSQNRNSGRQGHVASSAQKFLFWASQDSGDGDQSASICIITVGFTKYPLCRKNSSVPKCDPSVLVHWRIVFNAFSCDLGPTACWRHVDDWWCNKDKLYTWILDHQESTQFNLKKFILIKIQVHQVRLGFGSESRFYNLLAETTSL